MTGFVMSVLKRLGIAPAFTQDEMIDASIEDNLRDHGKAVNELVEAAQSRNASNERLREALQIAKLRTTAFADLEVALKGGKRGNGNAS